MGNYISCALITTSSSSSRVAARVVFPTGEIRQFHESITAAEMMLESPNFFVVNSRSLHIGRRFSPLSADEDLECGNAYIMFPMRKLNSIVTAGDMAVLFMAANSAAKRLKSIVGMLPESGGAEEETADVGSARLEFNYRFGACRSRKPALETIGEEPICFM